MVWACSACTYVNTGGSSCEICSASRNSASFPSASAGDATSMDEPEWSCLTCTFLNPINDPACEMCGEPKPDLSSQDPEALRARILSTTTFWPLRRPMSNAEVAVGQEPKHTSQSTSETLPAGRGMLSALPFRALKRKAADEGKEAKEAESSAADSTVTAEGSPEEAPVSLVEEMKDANAFLGNLHLERLARQSGASSATGTNVSASKSFTAGPSSALHIASCKSPQSIVIMTYNVWFQDLEVHKRMAAIGDIVGEHKPDVICFQEVTPDIYDIFQKSSWWSEYECSVPPELAVKRAYFCLQLSKLPVATFQRNPFRNSIMGRELCLAQFDIRNKVPLVVGTTHLESPCPAPPSWDQMFSKERVTQANESVKLLKSFPDVIFGGDMNWDDKLDGPPPLPDGWFDPWLKLHPDHPGLTYDGKANPMLGGARLRKRLDRFYCHLLNFDVESIEMIGQKAITNVTYTKEKKVKKQTQVMTLPVLPSDHFGLLLKITEKC